MSKITLSDVGSLIDATTAKNTINSNNAVIQTAFDNTLSRDGTSPNQMQSYIDMNSQRILNLPAPDTLNEPVRLADITGAAAAALSGTSALSQSVTTGSVVWPTQAGKQWSAGASVLISSTLSPTNAIHGVVTDYTGSNLTVLGTDVTGSGTFSSWNINLSGTRGPTGPGGGVPGGSNTQLQYNAAGSFAGISGATSNGTTVSLTSPSITTPTGIVATDINYTATGTGAVARTLANKVSDWVSVIDYGADPTGVADSTAAFNRAYAAAVYGGTVFMPAGNYLLNSYTNNSIIDTTPYPNKAVTLRGVGYSLKGTGGSYANSSGSIIRIGSSIPNTVDFFWFQPTIQVTGMGFRDFAIIPSGGSYFQPYGRNGIHIDTSAGTTGYVDFMYIDNISIDNFAAGHGLYVHGQSGGNTMIGCVIQNSQFMTSKFVNIADDVTFHNNIYGANALTYVSAAAVAAGGSSGTNGTQVVTVSGGSGTGATLNVTVAGGAITAVNSVLTPGFYSVFPTSPAAVVGAGLVGATVNLTQLFPNTGIDVTQVTGATNLKIVGNNFVSQDGAIRVGAAQTPIIRDNELEQNPGNNTQGYMMAVTSSTVCMGAVVTGNSLSNNASGSVIPIFVGNAQNALVTGNTIYTPLGGNHITTFSGAAGTRISQNTYYTNGVPAALSLTDGGTLTENDAAWKAYTPTITSGGGAFTTTTVNSAAYRINGKMLHINADISLNSVGTATGTVGISLPSGLTAKRSTIISGREIAINGSSLATLVGAGGSVITCLKYDGVTTIIANGAEIVLSGTIELT
jgi:hypothetical protein